MAVAMAAAALSAGEAAGEPRYDKALAKATAERVAKRLGEMRGGFGHDETPVLVSDMMTTQSVARAFIPKSVRAPWQRAARPIPAARLDVRIVYAGTMHAMF